MRAPSFADDVRSGLSLARKSLPSVHLYDAEGSRLFEAICALPEYYLTRAEQRILLASADAIVAELLGVSSSAERDARAPLTLIELGSGSSSKTRTLIEAFLRARPRLRYVPIDVSREMLEETSHALEHDYEGLSVEPMATDYHSALRSLPVEREMPNLIAWLGSSVGNLDRQEAAAFLGAVASRMRSPDRFLLGVDYRNDASTLEHAYDDEAGVTARFNLNLLARINRELGGHFDLGRFEHRAIYDTDLGRVTMHLVSRGEQRVRIDALELEVHFADGEDIHTESSWKYAPEEIDALAKAAGFTVNDRYVDDESGFSLNLLARA